MDEDHIFKDENFKISYAPVKEGQLIPDYELFIKDKKYLLSRDQHKEIGSSEDENPLELLKSISPSILKDLEKANLSTLLLKEAISSAYKKELDEFIDFYSPKKEAKTKPQ